MIILNESQEVMNSLSEVSKMSSVNVLKIQEKKRDLAMDNSDNLSKKRDIVEEIKTLEVISSENDDIKMELEKRLKEIEERKNDKIKIISKMGVSSSNLMRLSQNFKNQDSSEIIDNGLRLDTVRTEVSRNFFEEAKPTKEEKPKLIIPQASPARASKNQDNQNVKVGLQTIKNALKEAENLGGPEEEAENTGEGNIPVLSRVPQLMEATKSSNPISQQDISPHILRERKKRPTRRPLEEVSNREPEFFTQEELFGKVDDHPEENEKSGLGHPQQPAQPKRSETSNYSIRLEEFEAGDLPLQNLSKKGTKIAKTIDFNSEGESIYRENRFGLDKPEEISNLNYPDHRDQTKEVQRDRKKALQSKERLVQEALVDQNNPSMPVNENDPSKANRDSQAIPLANPLKANLSKPSELAFPSSEPSSLSPLLSSKIQSKLSQARDRMRDFKKKVSMTHAFLEKYRQKVLARSCDNNPNNPNNPAENPSTNMAGVIQALLEEQHRQQYILSAQEASMLEDIEEVYLKLKVNSA